MTKNSILDEGYILEEDYLASLSADERQAYLTQKEKAEEDWMRLILADAGMTLEDLEDELDGPSIDSILEK